MGRLRGYPTLARVASLEQDATQRTYVSYKLIRAVFTHKFSVRDQLLGERRGDPKNELPVGNNGHCPCRLDECHNLTVPSCIFLNSEGKVLAETRKQDVIWSGTQCEHDSPLIELLWPFHHLNSQVQDCGRILPRGHTDTNELCEHELVLLTCLTALNFVLSDGYM